MQSAYSGWQAKAGYLPALSIQQPYAWRIVNGLQTVEHRSWHTSYRGPLLIHAPQKIDVAAIEKLPDVPKAPSVYDVGGIVGMATLTGIAYDGQYGFLLRDAKPLPFVPFKGALGLFDVPESVLERPEQEGTVLHTCCRHCGRGVSVCGDLSPRGLCAFCISKGYDTTDLSHLAEGNLPEGSIVICARKSSGRTAMKWDKGDLCYVELEGVQYPGKVLDWAFSPDGDYLQTRIEYYVTYKDWGGQSHTRAVQWPRPIQSYKLRRRIA